MDVRRLLCILALALPLPADVLYSSGPANTNQFDITYNRLADDFTLSAFCTLNSFTFWYTAQYGTDLSEVTWAIYQDNSGALGTQLATATNATADGSDVNAFTAQVTGLNVALGPGIYWLELHAGSSLTDTNNSLAIQWAAVDGTPSYIALYNAATLPDTPVNTPGYDQYAFQLDGVNVPEPSALLTGGAAILILFRFRGKRPVMATIGGVFPACK